MWEHLRVEQALLSDILSRTAALLVGGWLVVATTLSLLRTVVIPRALRSLISDAVAVTVVSVSFAVARVRRTYPKRDGVLAWTGPVILLAQLMTWTVLYLVAYGLLIRGVSGMSFGDSMRESGSSLLTLGFAAVNTENQTIIDFLAAATGPIVIALMIGFLPNIYSNYIDREVTVTMLSTVGGEPAWGPELLSRVALANDVDNLPRIFTDWMQWATRLRLTHVTYPVLVWVRSVRANRHYVVSLTAVMDAAALRIALSTEQQREAAALLLSGGQALEVLYTFLFSKRRWRDRSGFQGEFTGESQELERSLPQLPEWDRRLMAIQAASDHDILRGLDADAVAAVARGDRASLRITREEFDFAVDVLRRSGFPIDRDLDEAWDLFRIARTRYEFASHEVCRRLDATPAPWTGPRNQSTATLWPTLAINVLPSIDAAFGGDDPEASA